MKLHLIEGTASFFRAYHTTPKEMVTPAGMPCGALFGYCQIIARTLRWHEGTHLAVALDGRGSRKYRQEILPTYKTNRPELDEALQIQLPHMLAVTEAFGVPVLEADGYEADDVIATVATQWQRENPYGDCVIVSIDKDFMQLANSRISVYDPVYKKGVVTPDDIFAKFGVPPHAIPDAQALMGDRTDNIPGVHGVGKVAASNLLNTYGSLDGVYANIDAIKPDSLRSKLVLGKDNAYLSYRLAMLYTEVPVQMPASLERSAIDFDRLSAFCAQWGFDELMKEMREAA